MDLSVFSRSFAEARALFIDALRDHFFPPFDDGKMMVPFRADQVFRQALAGLGEPKVR